MNWTEKHIEQLKRDGKIKGFAFHKKAEKYSQKPGKNIPQQSLQNIPARSKEKDWLAWNLMYWANEHALSFETEFQFDEKRKWKFDYCFPGIKNAVEYEGIFKKDKGKTGHSSITGVLRDIDKYNAAMLQGWKIIRVTAKDYKQVLQKLNELYGV